MNFWTPEAVRQPRLLEPAKSGGFAFGLILGLIVGVAAALAVVGWCH